MLGVKKLNEMHLEKTADLSLEIGKAMFLATAIGLLFPGVGEKIGLTGSFVGFIILIACYLFAMWLLREVKRK